MARAVAKNQTRKQSADWTDNLKTLLYAGLIAIGFRTIAFEPFNIPSPSMVPTLLVGDYLFVSKWSYGYSRFSLPWPLSALDWSGRVLERMPKRGDVVVFKLPSDTNVDYIKRLIGLPGDHIHVSNGLLYINGALAARTPDGVCTIDGDGVRFPDSRRFVETLPDGLRHVICKQRDDEGTQNNTPDYVVPADHVFMMGDNRDDSTDSRFMTTGVGFVPLDNLVGRAEFVFFSVDGRDDWWKFWRWPAEIRWGRLLHGVR